MQRRSIKIRTLIIFFAILLIGSQFGVYYFLDKLSISIAICVILNLILCHIYLESSLSYENCFIHSLITMLLSTACTVLIYVYQSLPLMKYSHFLWFLTVLQWVVPLLYCIIRNLGDRGPRFVGFRTYFIATSILFAVYYAALLAYSSFLSPVSFPAAALTTGNFFIPFMATASIVENAIYLGTSLVPLLTYIAMLLLLFVPMGFYLCLILKKSSAFIKLALALVIPCIFEAIPLLSYSSDKIIIDSCLYRMIGIFLGMLLYQILNQLSNYFLNCDFLKPRNNYSFFNMYY